MAYCNNDASAGFDIAGLNTFTLDDFTEVEGEDYFWGTVYMGLLAATVFAIEVESLMYNHVYNMAGFLNWLTGGGDVTLSWECFDNKEYYRILMNEIYAANAISLNNAAKQLAIGGSISIAPVYPQASSIREYGFVSHNTWISKFSMSILSIGNISAVRPAQDSFSYSISATLQCSDIGDFNPGESFGLFGVFKDDWFIYLQNRGLDMNFNEKATITFIKTGTGNIFE